MIPISYERREVAARLRRCAQNVSETLDFAMYLSYWVGIDRGSVMDDEGNRFSAIADRRLAEKTLERLADLIEPPEITEDTSDGFHTFGQLYYQRMVLFAVLVQEHKDRAWKTWNHEDGEPCFGGGWFLVTIDTPRGAYGYHFEAKYWRLFDCPELPKAKHWDGYTEEDANRMFSLNGYEVSGDAQ